MTSTIRGKSSTKRYVSYYSSRSGFQHAQRPVAPQSNGEVTDGRLKIPSPLPRLPLQAKNSHTGPPLCGLPLHRLRYRCPSPRAVPHRHSPADCCDQHLYPITVEAAPTPTQLPTGSCTSRQRTAGPSGNRVTADAPRTGYA